MYRVKSGFTLIELLVVIAIIAIIAAILFPVFAKAREKARQATCQSNEKQIGLAFVQYTQDYDECAMLSNNVDANWVKRVYPYIKSVAVFACPDDTSTNGSATISLISYALNSNVVSLYGNYSPKPVLVSKINAPAKSVFAFEIQAKNGLGGISKTTNPPSESGVDARGNGAARHGGDIRPNSAYYNTGFMAGFGYPANVGTGCNAGGNFCWWTADGVHTGGSNFIFCDSHVKWLPGSLVSTGFSATDSSCTQDAGGNCSQGLCDLSGCYPAGTAGRAADNAAGSDVAPWAATFSMM